MSNNNRQGGNINKPKVYITPFKSNGKNLNSKNFNGKNFNDKKNIQQKSYLNNNNLYGKYKDINKQNTDIPKTPVKMNPDSKCYFPKNNRPLNNKNLNTLFTPAMFDRIESIEIFPMDGTNNSITYKSEDLKNTKDNNFFNNILKKILLRDTELDKKEDIVTPPEFVVDINKDYLEIEKPIKTLDDLIDLGKSYSPDTADNFAINLKRLNKLVEPLTELKNVIGMTSVKDSIVDQIIYFLQSFEENNNMLHTIIEGPPGVGKTMLGYILGKIYYNMGVLKGSQNASNSLTGKKDDFVFKIVKRKDLIGEYLGHTAVKTQKAIDECKGGVLFIDEAYSLGNTDKKDTYSKECIDTINQNLSENKNNFMCIIAGYPEQLEQCFFSYNEGLKRRFTFKYTIEKYNAKELTNIFKKMVCDSNWELDVDDKKLEEFINQNIKEFENFGGDMETLLFRTKITHSKRVFGKHPRDKKKINIDDIQKAFTLFKSNKKKEINILSEEVLRNIYT
jgi:SpoVK/Ycf46/Vps4 family AAA+-type ATPase